MMQFLTAIPGLFSSIGTVGTAGAAGAAEGATTATALGEAAGAAGTAGAEGGNGLMGTLSSLVSPFMKSGYITSWNGDRIPLDKPPSTTKSTSEGGEEKSADTSSDGGNQFFQNLFNKGFTQLGEQAGSQPTQIQAPSAAGVAPLQQMAWQRNQPINFWRNRHE